MRGLFLPPRRRPLVCDRRRRYLFFRTVKALLGFLSGVCEGPVGAVPPAGVGPAGVSGLEFLA